MIDLAKRFLWIALAGLASTPVAASTVVLDWDGAVEVECCDAIIYHEDGFEYVGSGAYQQPTISLHDDSFGIDSSYVIPINGGTFSLKSFELGSYSRYYLSPDLPAEELTPNSARVPGPRYLLARFYFYKFGVAQQPIDIYSDNPKETKLKFGKEYRNLTAFSIQYFLPPGDPIRNSYGYVGPNELWCDEWCGDIILRNIKIKVDEPAAVPLPAAIGPALTILGFIGAFAVRQRKRVANKNA